jgi:cell division protein FtsW (lipid II flippase)
VARGALKQIDRPLLLVVIAIATLGLYNLASASQPLGADLHVKQGMAMFLGAVIVAAIASVHYRNIEGLAVPIFLFVVALLVATSMFGKVVNGSRRWLVLGPLNLQTSDLAKIAVIIIVAKTFHMSQWEGGLTLQEIFRPLNVSRPVLVIVAVIVLSIFGETVKPPKLTKQFRNRPRTVLRLRGDAVQTIGRVGDVDVKLQHSGVARNHARIEVNEEGERVIVDLTKQSGVYLNGERIAERAVLHDGDVVRFGTNQRAELTYRASMERIRPLLPWVAIVGFLWLMAAFVTLYRRRDLSFEALIAPIDVVAIPCALILVQPDLGTTLVVLLIAFTMILYVGLRPSSLVLLFSGGLISGAAAWLVVLKPYQKERVLTFLNPTSDLAGAGYHQHQSLIAIGSGEVMGKGHGQGTQTQLSFLPEQQTDFIFSVWAEEHGFLGCMLLVGLFAALIVLALRIAVRARDRFGALLAVGATAMLFWHTVVNMLMVLRLAPVVGVPLPLWSNGGSFVLTTMIAIGLLLSVSMRRHLF